MKIVRQARRIPFRTHSPDQVARLSGGGLKRCGVCWRIFGEGDAAGVELENDGVERCLQCREGRTVVDMAAMEEEDAAAIAARPITPQISQAPLEEPLVAGLNTLETSSGAAVTSAAPLRMNRNVAATLLLRGVRFSSSDTISYSSGITDSSAISRTDTVTTLTLIADLAMTPGDHYHLTFNGTTYRDVFSVR